MTIQYSVIPEYRYDHYGISYVRYHHWCPVGRHRFRLLGMEGMYRNRIICSGCRRALRDKLGGGSMTTCSRCKAESETNNLMGTLNALLRIWLHANPILVPLVFNASLL